MWKRKKGGVMIETRKGIEELEKARITPIEIIEKKLKIGGTKWRFSQYTVMV